MSGANLWTQFEGVLDRKTVRIGQVITLFPNRTLKFRTPDNTDLMASYQAEASEGDAVVVENGQVTEILPASETPFFNVSSSIIYV